MEQKKALAALRRRWYVPIIGLLLGAGLAFAYTSTLTKVYTASARVFVQANTQNTRPAEGEVDGWRGGVFIEQFGTYATMAQTQAVLKPLAEEFDGRIPGTIVVKPVPDSAFLDVVATAHDPSVTAALANAAAAQLGEAIVILETPGWTTRSDAKVSTLAPATPPQSAIYPKTLTNILMGAILGLALGTGLVLLREALDNTVGGADELESVTGSVPLGVISTDRTAQGEPLVSLNQRSSRSESFRILRANLQYVDVDDPPRTIAVTSAVPNEGKTTTACNLAITLAQADLNVCLVDADLRRPKVADYLGLDDALGLTDVLVARSDLDDAIVMWNGDLLAVLPSGPLPPNPSELLGSEHMRSTLDALSSRFDFVIVDTAPLLPVADASLVSAAADGAILVVRQDKTAVDQVRKSLEMLNHVDARLLGSVLNYANSSKKSGYGYGYGYGYGDGDARTDAKETHSPVLTGSAESGESRAAESEESRAAGSGESRAAESQDSHSRVTAEVLRVE